VPDIAIGQLQALSPPIFTGPAGVGVGVAIDVAVAVGVGATVGVSVTLAVDAIVGVGAGVFSVSLPQAGSMISTKRLKTVNTSNQRFM
jgi:hypothetical protein